MAFVFRAEQTRISPHTSPALGPGTYHAASGWVKGSKPSSQFVSRQPRLQEDKKVVDVPGPGTYQHFYKANEKIVVKTGEEEIKIIEPPPPTSCFKSSSIRFKQVKHEAPGPGTYECVKNKEARAYEVQVFKPNIIKELMRVSNYQSIPSIPSAVHVHGYSETANHVLKLNQVAEIARLEHYEPPDQSRRTRGLSWKKQSAKTSLFQNKANQNLGPGCYELVKERSVSTHMSKTYRRTDYEKGDITLKHLAQKIALSNESFYQPSVHSKPAQSTHVQDNSDLEDIQVFQETANPGPGHYNIPSGIKAPFSRKIRGKVKSRFETSKNQTALGPGSYNLEPQRTYFRKHKHPFLFCQKRFQDQTKKVELPGPGYYEPRDDLQSQLLNKLQGGYKGKFGTIAQRFVYNSTSEEPGPGAYDSMTAANEKGVGSANFNSKVERWKAIKQQTPAPGTYNIQDGLLAKAQQEETDPDLIITKPPFGTGAARFQQKVIEEEEDEPPYQEPTQLKRKKPKPSLSRQPRFKEGEAGQGIGPGEYEVPVGEWSKKSFNILFAGLKRMQ